MEIPESERSDISWYVEICASTNQDFYYGISTVIYLHIDHNDAKKIHDEKLNGNLVVLGISQGIQ